MPNVFAEKFAQNPHSFPHLFDLPQNRVLMAEITEDEFRAASFLDQRIYTDRMKRYWASWRQLESASSAIVNRFHKPDFIFHIGHVGSTLISRILGELSEVFALREPLILRSFAEVDAIKDKPECHWSPAQYETRLKLGVDWLARTFDPSQRSMIKATSSVSEIAGQLMQHGRKSLFLYVRPERYLETILAGESSLQELPIVSGSRLNRLHAHIDDTPWHLWELKQAERVAMNWACEMTSLVKAADATPDDKIMWLDFDQFLAEPNHHLTQIIEFFSYQIENAEIEKLLTGPLMKQYSKAPEYEYSPDLRKQLLEQTRRERKADIKNALKWLDDAATSYPLIKRAIEQCR